MDGGYTLAQVRRLAVLPRGFIATLVDLGVLRPDDGPRFSHQDLVVLRTARQLRDAGVPARRVVQALRNAQAQLASGHLASVRLRANGGAVEASAGPRRFDALSGQLLLPLDEPAAVQRPWLVEVLQAGAGDGAEYALREALRRDPACEPAYVNLGALLTEAGRHDEALALGELAMLRCGSSPLVHFNRAIALEDAQRPDEAVAAYERALQLDPGLADAHFNLGLLLQSQGRTQAALRHFSAFRRFSRQAQAPLSDSGPGPAGLGWWPNPLMESDVADDESKRDGLERHRININEDQALHDWAARFGVSVERLREAVMLVGNHADEVERYLKDGTRSA